MLKISVFESNWFNSHVEEFDNVFDALRYARKLRAEDIDDRTVEIYCDPWQVICASENISRTDKVAAGTYVDYDSLPEPEEAPEDEYEEPIRAEEEMDFMKYVLTDAEHILIDRETRDEALYELKNGATIWHTPYYCESIKFSITETDSKAAKELIDMHDGLMEEARMWLDQWAKEIGFDDVETEDTAFYERKLEEQYVYLCKLKGVEPLACYISK